MIICLIYSQQYRKPCVVASPTDAADDVIAACRAGGAVGTRLMYCSTCEKAHEASAACPICGLSGSNLQCDEEEFVVQLRDDVGPELWTEAALRRSLGKGI